MRILDAEAMRGVDRAAIDELGIPGVVLMENAALAVAEAVAAEYPEVARVAILCGPGNNGGDGLALARLLDARGYTLSVARVASKEPRGDAAVQLGICRKAGLPLVELEAAACVERLEEIVGDAELVVDALFGTGLSRPFEGAWAELVQALDGCGRPLVAVDLPSGLDAGSARPIGVHLRAELTVAFAAPKIAHVFEPAAEAAGRVVVADLGIPRRLIEDAAGDLRLLEAGELAALLTPRPAASHKGDNGHALIVAGSAGSCGAAVLAARAAVRAGAGLVTLALPEPFVALADAASIESMTLGLPAVAGALAEEAAEPLLAAAAGKQALAVGPGLGQLEETRALIRRLVLETTAPLVLDADGINAFAGDAEALAGRGGALILTPHPGELGRLLGEETSVIQADRPATVRRAAAESGAVVVLKGHRTLIADPLGGVAVNPTGNPGMASGGSGDVLTGVIAALTAQGLDAPLAAELGVFVHGLAGDRAAAEVGERALAAGDLVDALGGAFRELEDA